ncbi:MAG: hypothetical protein IPK17_01615 [Chloroflexi bacterium]|uniref:hypothetical protein n=1 Tax=Candidatus Flexifilum breve TaxID=3140694 RepID=UPI0031354506|nr:hypothetical protein [Chloroflexota bacterium]
MERDKQLIEALIQALTFVRDCVDEQHTEAVERLKEAMLPKALELCGFSFDPKSPAYVELVDDFGDEVTLQVKSA